jgi:DNA-binding NtrC family response regulator
MNNKTVLILEDDPDLLLTFTEVITSLTDQKVLAIKNITELHERRNEALTAHVALMDINIRHSTLTGLDAAKWLQQEGYKGQLYFVTGHTTAHPAVIEAQKIQNAKLLKKPITIDSLLEAIQSP